MAIEPWPMRLPRSMLARREGDKVRGRRAIIIRDRRGLEITAGGAEAVARFDGAIAAYLAFRADVGARLEAIVCAGASASSRARACSAVCASLN